MGYIKFFLWIKWKWI